MVPALADSAVIPDLAELAAFFGTAWLVSRCVDWVYRGNEPAPQPEQRPVGWS